MAGDEFQSFDFGIESSPVVPMEIEPLNSIPGDKCEVATHEQFSENVEIALAPTGAGNSRRLANGKAKSLVRKQLDVKLLAERVVSQDLLVFVVGVSKEGL